MTDAELVAYLRSSIATRSTHEAADRLSALAAVVAAVHTALNQYDDGLDTTRPFIAVLDEFVSAVAKAVRP